MFLKLVRAPCCLPPRGTHICLQFSREGRGCWPLPHPPPPEYLWNSGMPAPWPRLRPPPTHSQGPRSPETTRPHPTSPCAAAPEMPPPVSHHLPAAGPGAVPTEDEGCPCHSSPRARVPPPPPPAGLPGASPPTLRPQGTHQLSRASCGLRGSEEQGQGLGDLAVSWGIPALRMRSLKTGNGDGSSRERGHRLPPPHTLNSEGGMQGAGPGAGLLSWAPRPL